MLKLACAAGLMASAAFCFPAWAEECDVALSLSFDVSGSMQDSEHYHMREGTARALLDEEVRKSFREGVIYLQITEWGQTQHEIMPWTRVREADLETVYELLLRTPRSINNSGESTHLGAALVYAQSRFDLAPPCDRQVLDVAGDGWNNGGIHPVAARAAMDPAIQINGLAVDAEIEQHYRTEIQQGPGSFTIVADGYENFFDAMKRKMTMELFLSYDETSGQEIHREEG